MQTAFQCKQFRVADSDCAMKVGTDSLLLGAWSPLPEQGPYLDIGTGSGLLALMIAQRSAAFVSAPQVDAIEIDPDAARQAQQNTLASPWSTRIRVLERNILTYPASADHAAVASCGGYSLFISNPPYFVESLASPDRKRQQARHSDSLPFTELLAVCAALASDTATFCLILPVTSAELLLAQAPSFGWHLTLQQAVKATPAKDASRLLLQLSRQATAHRELEPLLIRDHRQDYSPEYRQLLRDFYLRF